MKVVDENFSQYTSNDVTSIYTFDYQGAENILLSMVFRPTLSNAQAIRTIYSQTNNEGNQKILMSDVNELLDYKFRDRLNIKTNQSKSKATSKFGGDSFRSSMKKLQSRTPPEGSFPMTMKAKTYTKTSDGTEVVNEDTIHFRLAIPTSNKDLLTLLLDDGDMEHNPRYTGIMPNIQAEFTLQGISGIRTFSMFRVRGLPEPYSEENIVFRTINVTDSVVNGNWVTTIVAGIIPLRGLLKSQLAITRDSSE